MHPEVQTFLQNLSLPKISLAAALVQVLPLPNRILSICNGDVKLIQVEPFEGSADRIIQMVPDVVDKISETFSKKKEERAAKRREKAAKELEN